MDPKRYYPLIALTLLFLVNLACTIVTADESTRKRVRATMDAQEELEAARTLSAEATADSAVEASPATPLPPPAGGGSGSKPAGDAQIIFTYSGENQSYHTGLRNRTPIFLDRAAGTARASAQESFEEPLTSQISRGTDTVIFDGTYDAATQTISGTLRVETRTTFGNSSLGDSLVEYTMSGVLSARLQNGQWIGSVTGSSLLKQSWPGRELPAELTEHTVNWSVVGTETPVAP